MGAVAALNRRQTLIGLGGLSLMPTGSTADAFPERVIKIVVPLAAGGINDAAVRIVAARLAERLRSPVIVENMPGAGAIVGTRYAAKAEPDGYTVLHAQPTAFTMNPNMVRNLPYNVQKDFLPIAPLYLVSVVLLGRPDAPARSLDEVVDLSKTRPGTMPTALYGLGTSAHLAMEWLRVKHGADLLRVPYRGVQAATLALLSGEVTFTFCDLPSALPLIRSGQASAIVLLQNAPSSVAPTIPTTSGEKYGLLDLPAWGGLFVPTRTPPARARLLSDAVSAIVSESSYANTMSNLGADVYNGTGQDLADRVARDTGKVKRIIADANLVFEN